MWVAILVFLIVVFLVYKLGTLVSSELLYYFYRPPVEKLSPEDAEKFKKIFFDTLFILLGNVAKSDGRVDASEIKITETYMAKMELDAEQRREAIQLFKAGADKSFVLESQLETFLRLAQKNPNLTEILLVYLVNLARIDGVMAEAELVLLNKIANGLGYTSIAFEHLVRMIASQNRFANVSMGGANNSTSSTGGSQPDEITPNELADAYDAIGVSPKASDREVKNAYRKLVALYHPDKLMGQGLPDFVIRAATERVKRIHAAYDFIKRSRG